MPLDPKQAIYLRISCGECEDPDALGHFYTRESWSGNASYYTTYLICTCGNQQVISERTQYD